MHLPEPAALVLVDLQRAMDDPSWGVRNTTPMPSAAERVCWRPGAALAVRCFM